jgi:hypothetical protein
MTTTQIKTALLSVLDTQPREKEKPRIGWKIYRANKNRPYVESGQMIDWFYSTDNNPIAKAKKILKNHFDFMYGKFVLIDEENGNIVSFSYIPSRREF